MERTVKKVSIEAPVRSNLSPSVVIAVCCCQNIYSLIWIDNSFVVDELIMSSSVV